VAAGAALAERGAAVAAPAERGAAVAAPAAVAARPAVPRIPGKTQRRLQGGFRTSYRI